MYIDIFLYEILIVMLFAHHLICISYINYDNCVTFFVFMLSINSCSEGNKMLNETVLYLCISHRIDNILNTHWFSKLNSIIKQTDSTSLIVFHYCIIF